MKPFVLPLALTALLVAAGCSLPSPQEDIVRNFTLSSPADGAAVVDAASVRPVRLAGHLRSRTMAVRISENEVSYLEDIRWAEPLDEAITQILRNRLRQVGTGATVTVQVQRCELVREGNAVQVAATYTVTPNEGDPRPGIFTAPLRAWDGKDYAGVVVLLREALVEMAEQVAAAAEKP